MKKLLVAAAAAMLATGAGLLSASAADKLKIGLTLLSDKTRQAKANTPEPAVVA